MKIIAISDLHGYLPKLEKCDLVCICGDIMPLEDQRNYGKSIVWLCNRFYDWCNALDCDKVLFIGGNHDFVLEQDYIKDLFEESCKLKYLCNEEYNYKGLKIYGTPYCKIFGNWAFMRFNEELEKIYENIPQDLDILLTHDQPYGYGDILLEDVPWNSGNHIGNKPLAKAVELKQPKYMFVGHLHSTTHSCVNINNTKRYNVSIMNEQYRPTYKPLILDI